MNEHLPPVNFPNIAVLVSGSGTNLQAIIDDSIPVRVVIADRQNIPSENRASDAGIEYVVIDRKGFKNQREEFTRALIKELKSRDIELIVFAGFLTITSELLIEAYEGKILNIHPSLLPAFGATYGEGTISATLKAGVKVTGVTIHVATKEVDAGPIIAQEAIEVYKDDDEYSLYERIHKVEHRLYPQTIRQFCIDNFSNNER